MPGLDDGMSREYWARLPRNSRIHARSSGTEKNSYRDEGCSLKRPNTEFDVRLLRPYHCHSRVPGFATPVTGQFSRCRTNSQHLRRMAYLRPHSIKPESHLRKLKANFFFGRIFRSKWTVCRIGTSFCSMLGFSRSMLGICAKKSVGAAEHGQLRVDHKSARMNFCPKMESRFVSRGDDYAQFFRFSWSRAVRGVDGNRGGED